jgi:hypothetical protein
MHELFSETLGYANQLEGMRSRKMTAEQNNGENESTQSITAALLSVTSAMDGEASGEL